MILVWQEAFLRSKKHWFSLAGHRKKWLIIYTILNVLVYSGQIVIYGLILLPAMDQGILLDWLFFTLSTMNFLLPVIFFGSFLFYSLKFAGFPLRSKADSKRFKQVAHLSIAWTLSRIGWGVVSLTTVLNGWFDVAEENDVLYSCLLIGIFLVTEIIPFVWSLLIRNLVVLQSTTMTQASHIMSGNDNTHSYHPSESLLGNHDNEDDSSFDSQDTSNHLDDPSPSINKRTQGSFFENDDGGEWDGDGEVIEANYSLYSTNDLSFVQRPGDMEWAGDDEMDDGRNSSSNNNSSNNQGRTWGEWLSGYS